MEKTIVEIKKIRFRDLSFVVKLGVIFSYVLAILLGQGIIRAFLEGLKA